MFQFLGICPIGFPRIPVAKTFARTFACWEPSGGVWWRYLVRWARTLDAFCCVQCRPNQSPKNSKHLCAIAWHTWCMHSANKSSTKCLGLESLQTAVWAGVFLWCSELFRVCIFFLVQTLRLADFQQFSAYLPTAQQPPTISRCLAVWCCPRNKKHVVADVREEVDTGAIAVESPLPCWFGNPNP